MVVREQLLALFLPGNLGWWGNIYCRCSFQVTWGGSEGNIYWRRTSQVIGGGGGRATFTGVVGVVKATSTGDVLSR